MELVVYHRNYYLPAGIYSSLIFTECDLENCVECSVGTPPKCQKCETDYVLEDGVCSGKDGATTREPTTSATTSDGGSNTNDKGLTDFEIAGMCVNNGHYLL